MTEPEREIVKACIRFYDERGWDWSYVVAFLIREFRRKKKRGECG